MDEEDQGCLDWAEQRLGHRFTAAALLMEALTHPSHAYEAEGRVPSNQRLEFLGDAVLGLIASQMLFRQFPGVPEGELTRLRQGLVSAPTLARRAQQLGVGEMLRLGRGEEASGGRERTSNLSDAFEALVAAVYLDAGLDAARRLVLRELAPEVEAARRGQLHPNYKARLLEWAQRERSTAPAYAVIAESGPDHDRRFRVSVAIAGQVVGEGAGRSKREAEQAAARAAWGALEAGPD